MTGEEEMEEVATDEVAKEVEDTAMVVKEVVNMDWEQLEGMEETAV